MQNKPRWMESILKTAKEDLPPLPFARSELRHEAEASVTAMPQN